VPRDADAVAIKRAFRARARECHPDLATAPGAAERFRALAAAYDVLASPDARLVYDHGARGDVALRPLHEDLRVVRYGAVAGVLVALAFLALLLFG
jgi:curved DNA-binding protein CbpA